MEKKLCDMFAGTKNQFGYYEYFKCDCPAKYEVREKSIRGNSFNTYFMCGKHLNAAKKGHARILKQSGYDTELTYKPL